MTFEEFWESNKNRYKKLAELNIMLAINIASEEAWEESNKEDSISEDDVKKFMNNIENNISR